MKKREKISMEKSGLVIVVAIVSILISIFLFLYLAFTLPSPYNTIMLFIAIGIIVSLIFVRIVVAIIGIGKAAKDTIGNIGKKNQKKKYLICPQCNTQVEKATGVCPKCGKNLLYSSKIEAK